MFALRFFFDIVRAQADSARLKKSPPPHGRGLFALRVRFYEVAKMDRRPRTKKEERELWDMRTPQPQPAPTSEEIRRQLGWDLIPANRRPDSSSTE